MTYPSKSLYFQLPLFSIPSLLVYPSTSAASQNSLPVPHRGNIVHSSHRCGTFSKPPIKLSVPVSPKRIVFFFSVSALSSLHRSPHGIRMAALQCGRMPSLSRTVPPPRKRGLLHGYSLHNNRHGRAGTGCCSYRDTAVRPHGWRKE